MKTKKLTAAFLVFSLLGGNSVFAASSTVPAQIASADFNYSKVAKNETTSPKSETQSEYKQVTVFIDGVKQHFDQPAIVKNGSTLVPLRGVFEALKADVKWDQPSQTVTANKGNTTIKLTVGQSIAIVNGKTVTLAAKAEVINGSTMVPLRFVSEALGADVKWDGNSFTATITSGVGGGQSDQGSSQVINGINVQYGKHHYGSKNQAEYDKVMVKLKQEVDSRLGNVKVGGNDFSEYYERYLNGERASNYERNTTESRGLTSAEKTLKVLVDLGLNKDDILKLTKLSIVGADILSSAKAVEGGAPDSLADLILRGVYDCDPEAYLYSAIFDMYGYNTAIVAGDNHASAFVQINGEWVAPMSGTFAKSDAAYLLSQSGFYIRSEPTFGGSLKGESGHVEKGGSQVVNGIKVFYGKHTYASANQSQYDQVMKIVNKAVSDMKSSGKLLDYYARYIDGARASSYPSNSDEYMELKIAENSIGQLVSAGATKEEITKAFLAAETGSALLKGVKDVGVGDPTSAYDALVGGVTDCDATSQTYSATFDSFGFSSAVLGGSNHADVFVKVHDTWFKYGSGTFTKVNLSKIPSSLTIVSQPTFGPEFTR